MWYASRNPAIEVRSSHRRKEVVFATATFKTNYIVRDRVPICIVTAAEPPGGIDDDDLVAAYERLKESFDSSPEFSEALEILRELARLHHAGCFAFHYSIDGNPTN